MKKRTLILIILSWAFQLGVQAQDLPYMQNAPDRFFNKIDPERLVSRVRDLASPAFQGRELGTPGNQKAADWLAFNFRESGITPFFQDSYRQQFPVAVYQLGEHNLLRLSNPDSTLDLHQQFVPAYYSDSDSIAAQAVFAGNGHSSIFGKTRTEGNIVVILQDQLKETQNGDLPNYFEKVSMANSFGASGVILAVPPGQVTPHSPTGSLYRYQEIKLPVEAEKNLANTAFPYITPQSIGIPVVFASSDILSLLFTKKQTQADTGIPVTGRLSNRTITMITDVKLTERNQASNIAGFIPGTAPDAKTVIMGANFDQQGQHSYNGAPFFGANRNAAAVTVMLEVMNILSDADRRPMHNIVFAGWNGLERNGAGIRYFNHHLPIDKSEIIGVINLLEVAGNKGGDDTLVDAELIPPNTMLSRALEKSKRYFNFTLHKNENKKNRQSKTNDTEFFDPHVAPLSQENIPVVSITGGRYPFSNRMIDTPDKLNYTQLYNMAHYVMNISWNLATIDFEHKKLQN